MPTYCLLICGKLRRERDEMVTAEPKSTASKLYESRFQAFQKHSATFLRKVLSEPIGSEFFTEALKHAVEMIPAAQAGSILHRGPDSLFYYVATYGFDAEKLKAVTYNQKEVFFGFDQQFEPFVVRDIDTVNEELDDERLSIIREAGRADEILATLVIPLTIEDSTVAAFTLDNFDAKNAFSEEDVSLAEMFAVHVAVGMKLQDYSSRFKEVFYNVPYPTLVLDRELTVTAANANFHEMTGINAESLPLMSLDLLLEEDVEKIYNIPFGESASWETNLNESVGKYWCRINVQHAVLDESTYLLSLFDLTRNRETEEKLRRTIDEVSADFYALTNRVKERLEDIQSGTSGTIASLTERDRILLRHLANGLTNSQIASLLDLSPNTINNNLTALYTKIGADGRYQAGMWAKEKHLD